MSEIKAPERITFKERKQKRIDILPETVEQVEECWHILRLRTLNQTYEHLILLGVKEVLDENIKNI